MKCLAQEHNTMSPARARTRTARSGDERTNHEATEPPLMWPAFSLCFMSLLRVFRGFVPPHTIKPTLQHSKITYIEPATACEASIS